MSSRRKAMLLLATNNKWLPYSYEYLLNSLVPTTIDSKNVLNQAKIIKLYGNGCVVNQLISPTIATQTLNGLTLTNNNDGSLTISGTATADTNFYIGGVTIQANHTYLLFGCASGGSSSTYALYCTGNMEDTGLGKIYKFTSAQTPSLRITIKNGTTINNLVFKPQLIDLSHSYSLGNEPTSINDNRIQTILNRGYIPYNTGEYVGTDISEIVSEPYNLFDEEWVLGNLSGTLNTFNCSSKNYIKVIGGKTYSFDNGSFITSEINGFYYREYDENYNQIGSQVAIYNALRQENQQTIFTVSSETRFIKFFVYVNNYNFTNNFPTTISIHLQGIRTGYAPYQEPITIPFKAQLNGAINSHDTLAISNTEYTFTKNVFSRDMGTMGWTYQSSNGRMTSLTLNGIIKPQTGYSTTGNVMCSKYTSSSASDLESSSPTNKSIAVGGNTYQICVYDSDYTDANAFTTAMSGTLLYFEALNPQTISIPRKHLGILQLSQVAESSFYPATTTNGRSEVIASGLPNCVAIDNNQTPNAYMKDYNVDTPNATYIFTNGIFTIKQYDSNRIDFYICDNNIVGMTKAQMKEYLSNYIIFYETQDEVDDIVNKIGIEAGGMLSATYNTLALLNLDTKMKCK